LTLTLTACGSSDDTSKASGDDPGASTDLPAGADPTLAAMVPDDIREAGTVEIGSSFSFQPLYYLDESNEPAGIIIEILGEANKRLGLTENWQQMEYPNLLIALQGGKIQVAGSQFTREAGSADQAIFFGLWHNGISLLVRKDTTVNTEDDVCGLKIGVPGSVQADIDWAEKVDGQCKSAGKDGVEMKKYDQTTDQLIALRSKQIDGMVNSTLSERYATQSDDNLVVTLTDQIADHISGFTVAKDQSELADAYEATINQMMQDGTFKAIFEKYDLGDVPLDKVVINPDIEE
jgi:polar amino acid transport system substrate-binding protein